MIDLRVPFEPQLPLSEELELINKFRSGDRKAGDTLLKYHTGLIVKEVSKRQSPHNELAFQDVFNAACLGFVEAIYKFDTSKGWRLSTYAMWWVKHFVGEEVSTIRSPHIRVPIQKQRELMKTEQSLPRVELTDTSTLEGMAVDDSYESIEQNKSYQVLHLALKKLPLRLRFIVMACYHPRDEDMYKWNTVSCSKLLGISKEYSRQLRNKGIEDLKAILKDEFKISCRSEV